MDPLMKPLSVEFVNETENIVASTSRWGEGQDSADSDDGNEGAASSSTCDTDAISSTGSWTQPKPGKKTRGRVKIEMKYIKNKVRRYTTFSKRKTGIMKKAYELSVLTGTQVMLLVASETGHVYTFATRKLHPMITSDNGKALIQTCLCSPDSAETPAADATERPVLLPASQTSAATGPPANSVENADCKVMPAASLMQPSSMSAQTCAVGDGRKFQKLEYIPANDSRQQNSGADGFKDVRSVGLAGAQRVTTSDVSSTAGTLGSGKSAMESMTLDLHPQGTTMMLPAAVIEPQLIDSFSEVDSSMLQQHPKHQNVYYQLPGTNQIISVQVECQMGESGSNPLTDQQQLTLADVGADSEEQSQGGTALLYQAPPGYQFAPSSTSSNSIPPEGYILNIPGTPAYAIPQEITSQHGKSDQQFFTIPLSSHSQLIQLGQSPAALGYIGSSPVGIRCSSSLVAPPKKEGS